MNKRKYKFLPFISLTVSMVLLLVGLWPFNFHPVNNVQRIDGGLRFDRYGIANSRNLVFTPGGVVDLAKPFTIRMEVRPREEPSGSLPRIVSIYDEKGREILFIGQSKSELILRIYEGDRIHSARHRETGVDKLQRDVEQTIAIRSDEKGMSIYVGGIIAIDKPGFNDPLYTNFRDPARLLLGNSPSGESPWRGDIYTFSVYSMALSPEEIRSPGEHAPIQFDLVIPSVFRAPKKGVLVPPWRVEKFNTAFWWDVIVNILGFIPFGFAMRAWPRKDGKRNRLTLTMNVVILGAAISLGIELLQVYLPSRVSSLTDVISNILGTYIGAYLSREAPKIQTDTQ